MLSAKAWKADAIMRLLLSVMVCVYAGSLLMSAGHYAAGGAKSNPRLFYALAAVAMICLVTTLFLIRKPWQSETFMQHITALVICAYGGLFLGMWVQRLSGVTGTEASIWRMSIAALSFQGAGLVLVARFLREHQSSWAEGFGLLNHRRQAVMLGLLVAVIFLPLSWGLQQASALMMTHLPQWLAAHLHWLLTHLPQWLVTYLQGFKLEPKEQLPVHALRVSASWGGRLALGVAAVLLAPVAEEVLFRGILYPAIKQVGHPRLALWGTALLFAAIHMNLVTFLPLALLALVLTGLYEWTNNLLAPITAHVLFNALNFVMLLVLQHLGRL
jgi:membrane protease YdiL (CAAX protease family)